MTVSTIYSSAQPKENNPQSRGIALLTARGISADTCQAFAITCGNDHFRYPFPNAGGGWLKTGMRHKAYDSHATPKYWTQPAGFALPLFYFHPDQFVPAVGAANRAAWLVTEFDVPALHSAGIVNALARLGGENANVTTAHIDWLKARRITRLYHPADKDKTGHSGALKWTEALEGSGIEFIALDLPGDPESSLDVGKVWVTWKAEHPDEAGGFLPYLLALPVLKITLPPAPRRPLPTLPTDKKINPRVLEALERAALAEGGRAHADGSIPIRSPFAHKKDKPGMHCTYYPESASAWEFSRSAWISAKELCEFWNIDIKGLGGFYEKSETPRSRKPAVMPTAAKSPAAIPAVPLVAPATTPAVSPAVAPESVRDPDLPPPLSRFIPLHADALDTLPPVSWLIPQEIQAAGINVLFGASGVGKSFVALDYALQIAQTQPVVYVAAEGFRGIAARKIAWCQHHQKSAGSLYFIEENVPLLEDTTVQEFMTAMKALKPALIVFDTLAYAMTGGEENSAKDMQKLITACRRLQTAFGTAILLVHHTGKNGFGERGSSALRGGADMMIELSRNNGSLTLTCSKSKDTEGFKPRQMRLLTVTTRPDESSCVVVEASGAPLPSRPVKLTAHQREVLVCLSQECFRHKGASSGTIRKTTNIPEGTLHRILTGFKATGYIRQSEARAPYQLTPKGEAALGIKRDKMKAATGSGESANMAL